MAKTSLVGRAAANPSNLPAVAGTVGGYVPAVPETPDNVSGPGGSTPYVVFASTRGKSWANAAVACPGLKESDPVLIRPAPDAPVLLSPFRFFYVAGFEYHASRDANGKLTAVSPTRSKDLHTEVEALLLVFTPDGLVPARCTFKRGCTPAAQLAAEMKRKAESPEWGKLSPDHAASLQIPIPFGRFVVTASTGLKLAKTGGKRYPVTEGRVAPTGRAEAEELVNLFADDAGKAAYEAVLNSYNRTVAEVKGMADTAA
jgi:hypothetical protein